MDSALSGVANTIFPPLPLPSVNLPDTTDLPQSNFNNPSSQQPSSKKSHSLRRILSLHRSNTQPPSQSKRQKPEDAKLRTSQQKESKWGARKIFKRWGFGSKESHSKLSPSYQGHSPGEQVNKDEILSPLTHPTWDDDPGYERLDDATRFIHTDDFPEGQLPSATSPNEADREAVQVQADLTHAQRIQKMVQEHTDAYKKQVPEKNMNKDHVIYSRPIRRKHAEAERGLEEAQVSEPAPFKTVEGFGVFMDKCFEKINPLTFDEEFGASTD